ncbi:MAG: exodeoxyribonuclease V subunit alpha [Parachlamydiaceae bacterium]|nr:exodeoxyribonuclease V subunit alpha [Parachlamydiaceae bacterium]
MHKQGLAKAQFFQKFQRTPWLSKYEEKKHAPIFPLFDQFLKKKRLSYLDYSLVHHLLEKHPDVDETVAFFICHLILSAREGHLCINIDGNVITPSIFQIWSHQDQDFNPSIDHDEELFLTNMILEGEQQVPANMMMNFDDKDGGLDSYQNIPLCKNGHNWYLQKNWIYETLFLHNFKSHLTKKPTLTLDVNDIQKTLNSLCQNEVLLEEQAKAILEGCVNSFTLIAGGPGTGKTYTAGHLMKLFWKHLSKEQKSNCKIALAAPTGKAAANLSKSLMRVIESEEDFPVIEAKTLHALLGIKQDSEPDPYFQIQADLLVIDESSMIDIKMMAWVFKSLKPGSRLILLGDQCQLPSVDAGGAFADLFQFSLKNPHLKIPCIFLKTCLRAELKELISFAKMVNEGNTCKVFDLLKTSSQGIKWLTFSQDQKKVQKQFIEYSSKFFPFLLKENQDPDEFIERFNQIRILSPLRKGDLGVEEINGLIWHQISKNLPSKGWVAIPIIMTANDYRLKLFNGETGVLLRKLPLQSINSDDFAIFPSQQSNQKNRHLSALLLSKFEYAYCLSVHKSQGTEFQKVILVLPKGSEGFGREILYTAVTRAKKEIEIFGTDEVIEKTIQQQGVRLSGIQKRLSFILI